MSQEQKDDLLERLTETMKYDILTRGDMLKIIDVCTEALERSIADVHEKKMIALLTDDDDGKSEEE